MSNEITKEEVKKWVVNNASITRPYKPGWKKILKSDQRAWSASVTIGGMDINRIGDTIEEAYNSLTELIFNSKYHLDNFPSTT